MQNNLLLKTIYFLKLLEQISIMAIKQHFESISAFQHSRLRTWKELQEDDISYVETDLDPSTFPIPLRNEVLVKVFPFHTVRKKSLTGEKTSLVWSYAVIWNSMLLGKLICFVDVLYVCIQLIRAWGLLCIKISFLSQNTSSLMFS